jgi:hypothetical protein
VLLMSFPHPLSLSMKLMPLGQRGRFSFWPASPSSDDLTWIIIKYLKCLTYCSCLTYYSWSNYV